MTRTELLNYYRDVQDADDYKNYVKNHLVPHWKEESQGKRWEHLVTANFALRHSVEGTLTEQKARDVCRARSNQGTSNFTSTSLSATFMQKIVEFIYNNIIATHKDRGTAQNNGFVNYEIDIEGTMITVQSKANEGFLPTMYRDKVVVGINREGLINHFHGDAQYADGDIYHFDGDTIRKKR